MSTVLQGIALVTGASRGIGHAIALELGKHGLIVVGTATTASGAEDISKKFFSLNISGQGLQMDVNDIVSVDTTIGIINRNFGIPTILVNNVGITRDNLVIKMSYEDWNDVINTNLSSVYYLSKALIRGMLQSRHGRIVNVTSVVGITGNAGQANYAAAKAGIIGFTKSLALEVGSRGITVNAVAPGAIDTEMTRTLSIEQRNKIINKIPLRRLGTTQDIATAVRFLVSQEAAYITGETLHVNGGMHMQ